jgi:hypothetical protein
MSSKQDQTDFDEKCTVVLDELKRHEIERVDVPFEGGGDEGHITDVEAYDSQGNQVDLSPLRSPRNPANSLRDVLEELANEALDEIGVDWWNDLGGDGTVTINAVAGTIRTEVNKRIEEIETTEWEYKI